MKNAEIKFDSNMLIGKIAEVFKTREKFAKAVSMSRSAVSKRLANEVDMTIQDILEWAKALKIPNEEIPKYFFQQIEDDVEVGNENRRK